MTLLRSTYGKGRVRVMRIARETERHEVRELEVQAMLTGDFDRAFTSADNSACISTDTVKNVVNVVARQHLDLDSEAFCLVLAERFLSLYERVASVSVRAFETRWHRLLVDGQPHAHSFTLDGNGKPHVAVEARRGEAPRVESGVRGFTFMKTTQSGWDGFAVDPFTTIPPTRDRMCATSLDATWAWGAVPADPAQANATILSTMLKVFATTYSESVQDSLYRMATAALAEVPEVERISLAAPNRHYLLIDLGRFGLDNPNTVFLPTDEPHGQIECVVGR